MASLAPSLDNIVIPPLETRLPPVLDLPESPKVPLPITTPHISIAASKMIPRDIETLVAVDISNDGDQPDIHVVTAQELTDIVNNQLYDLPELTDEEAMNEVRDLYQHGTNAVRNNPMMQQEILDNTRKLSSRILPGYQAEIQTGGAKSFEKWEETIMKCGFEHFIVDALTYIWVPEWVAKQIAWYIGAFIRGVAGITWAVIKSIFSFVWNNKVSLIVFMGSFATVMNMFQPILAASKLTNVQEIAENAWSVQANLQTANMVQDIGRLDTQSINPQYFVSRYGGALTPDKQSQLMSLIKGMFIDHSMTSSQFAASTSTLLYDNAKRLEQNIAIIGTSPIELLQPVVDSYNHFLGGHISDYVGYVENGIKNAVHMWRYGYVSPTNVSWSTLRMPLTGREIPNPINLSSLTNSLALGMFIIKGGTLALDLGSRMWTEISQIQATCAMTDKPHESAIKQRARNVITKSRLMQRK